MSFPKDSKRAALILCPAASSRRLGERSWEVFDSQTGESLGRGRNAHVAWYLAGLALQERITASSANTSNGNQTDR
jgi:hypothetical protein